MKIEFDPVKSQQNINMKKPNPKLIDEENPEWTEKMFKSARPANESLPEIFGADLGFRTAETKTGTTWGSEEAEEAPRHNSLQSRCLRVFRSTGPGWQARIDAALKEWVAQHGPDSERRDIRKRARSHKAPVKAL